MDLSLWDPPVCEDESSDFGGNLAENWCKSDFYSGYGVRDVMEEDALNERACTQVLKIMLSRAKTEIEEVEEEITVLQRQLAWANEVWSKKHTTLRERINSLDALIQRFKNEEQQPQNAFDFHFQKLEERAEKLSVMLKTLLEGYTPNIDVQNPSPTFEKLAPTESKEETKLSNWVAKACDTKILEETVGPPCTADQTRDVIAKDQNGDATSSDLVTNCCKHATNVPIHWDMDGVNVSMHMGQETEYQDSTTKAKERLYRTEVDKLADMTSDCRADAAKKISKESILKRKLKMQDDDSRTSLINIGKQVDRTGRMTIELVQFLDSERTIGESLEELVSHRRREKAPVVEQVQNTGVVGKEPHMSNLCLKSGGPKLTEEQFPIDSSVAQELSLAVEMELQISSMRTSKRNMISGILNEHVGKNCRYENNYKEKGDKSNSAAAAYVNMDSDIQSIGKRTKCLPSLLAKKIVESKNLRVNAKMDEDVTSSLIREEDEDTWKEALLNPPKTLPCSTTMVANNSMSMAQLKAVAKERKLKGYSKLKKSDLIKLLG